MNVIDLRAKELLGMGYEPSGTFVEAKLKYAIDQVVKVSEDFDDFLAKCAEYGMLVEYNPDHKIDLKFMLAVQKENNPRAKFTRAKTLGCKNGFAF